MLERVAAELTREFPWLFVHGIGADFDHSLDRLPPGDRRLIAFLGSTIGNLRPADQAPELMRSIRRQMRSGDHFLLGVDLIKDRARLEAAYNDSRGVTAAFSRNIWNVVNRLADADFDPDAFRHLAFWDAQQRLDGHSPGGPIARSTSICARSTSSSTSRRARRSAPRSAPSTTGRAPRRCCARAASSWSSGSPTTRTCSRSRWRGRSNASRVRDVLVERDLSLEAAAPRVVCTVSGDRLTRGETRSFSEAAVEADGFAAAGCRDFGGRSGSPRSRRGRGDSPPSTGE